MPGTVLSSGDTEMIVNLPSRSRRKEKTMSKRLHCAIIYACALTKAGAHLLHTLQEGRAPALSTVFFL